MYSKNDKRRLYELMEIYLSGAISAGVFCDEYYYCYDLEVDVSELTELEAKAFADLGKVVSRFSGHKQDHQLDPKAFYNEKQLKQKVLETTTILK